jgi:hypothetical protein
MTTNIIIPTKLRSDRLSPKLKLNDFALSNLKPNNVINHYFCGKGFLESSSFPAESQYDVYITKWRSIYYPINEYCAYKSEWSEFCILLQNKNASTQTLINSIGLIDDIDDDLKLVMILSALEYRANLLRKQIRVSTPFGDMCHNGKETKQSDES